MFTMRLRWLLLGIVMLVIRCDQTIGKPLSLEAITDEITEENAKDVEPEETRMSTTESVISDKTETPLIFSEHVADEETVTEKMEFQLDEHNSTEHVSSDYIVDEKSIMEHGAEDLVYPTDDYDDWVTALNVTTNNTSAMEMLHPEVITTESPTTTEINMEHEQRTECHDPLHKHHSPDIETQTHEHRKWNADSVVTLMNRLVQLLEVPTNDWNEYRYITALRGPDGSLYVPQHPKQSTRQHLATLLGFADEILVSKNALAQLHEDESTSEESLKNLQVTTDSTLSESEPHKEHTEELVQIILNTTNTTAGINQSITYENNKTMESTQESGEWVTMGLTPNATWNGTEMLIAMNFTDNETMYPSDSSSLSKDQVATLMGTTEHDQEHHLMTPQEEHGGEAVKGLTTLLHKATKNIGGIINLMKQPEIIGAKLENLTKPFIDDVEAVAEKHLDKLLGTEKALEESLTETTLPSASSEPHDTEEQSKHYGDIQDKFVTLEKGVEEHEVEEQENWKEHTFEELENEANKH